MAGTIIQGNPSHITTPLTASVTSLVNNGSGLIRANTAAPHYFGQNDEVLVNAGSTDGTFQITVISPTAFDLQGSTFVSGGSGTAVDNSLTPAMQIPIDGDPLSAQLSGGISFPQMLMDRDAYLQKNAVAAAAAIAVLQAVQPEIAYYLARPPTPLAITPGFGWGNASLYEIATPNSSGVPGYVVQGTLTGLMAGDVIELCATVPMTYGLTSVDALLRAEVIENVGFPTTIAVPNSEQVIATTAGVYPLSLSGLYTFVGTYGSTLEICLNGYTVGGGVAQSYWKPLTGAPTGGGIVCKVWRPKGN